MKRAFLVTVYPPGARVPNDEQRRRSKSRSTATSGGICPATHWQESTRSICLWPPSPRAVEVSVLWCTEGKGDEDLLAHYFDRHASGTARPYDSIVSRRRLAPIFRRVLLST